MSVTPFYIYRHVRPDTNEVFYIGKGNNLDKRKSEYRRAFETKKRNHFWNAIFNKNNKNIKVDILFECETHEQANEKEIEFIKLYGRRNLGLGTLVNLTDGADGCFGVIISEETRSKFKSLGSPMKGKKHSDESRKKQSFAAKNRTTHNPFKGKKHNSETIELFRKNRIENPKQKFKFVNTNTGDVVDGVDEAAKLIGIHPTSLHKNLKNNYENNHTPIMYLEDYEKHGSNGFVNKERQRIIANCKKVIDIKTGEIYISVKETSIAKNTDVSTLRRRLNGKFKNTTTLILS